MSLPLWEECAWDKEEIDPLSMNIVEESEDEKDKDIKFIFPPDRSLSKKIYLHLGDIFKIPTDAIVIGQNESLRDMTEGNDAIIALAGPEVEENLALQAPIQTGESVITGGGSLPCDFLIHSVGPKYDDKYLTASDHALHSAYKTALILASDKKVKRISFSCIYKKSKKYPRFDAAHVALRTVRKYLQKPAGKHIEKVMFSVPTQDDYEIYTALLTAYFPRNYEEAKDQFTLLPEELGNEWGEIILADRVLHVSAGPKPLARDSLVEYRKSSISSTDGDSDSGLIKKRTGTKRIESVGGKVRGMSEIHHDTDKERKKKIQELLRNMSREERLSFRFQTMMEDMQDEELDDILALNFIHFGGNDFDGRVVVFITGANLVAAETSKERSLLYIMRKMETLRCVPYVLVYANFPEKSPEMGFLQEVFDLFACRYRDSMQQLYLLHSSFVFRMYVWVALPFQANTFWKSYISVENLQQLGKYMPIDTLEIPAKIRRQDMELQNPDDLIY